MQSNERDYAEWECWLDVHLVKNGTGRGCLALVSKRLETACLVRKWSSLDGLGSLRAVAFVSDAGSDQKNCRQNLLELARQSAWFLLFESDWFKHKLAHVV